LDTPRNSHWTAEQAYLHAIDLNRDQLLAWQGLSKFYERTANWTKYAETLQHLMEIYSRSDDAATKCAEALEKFIEIRRQHGTRTELIDALSLLLPNSSLYTLLSTLPPPEPTNPTIGTTSTFSYVQNAVYQGSLPILEEVITLIEKEEESVIKKEIEKRRFRINAAGPEQLKKEVGREVWSISRASHSRTLSLDTPFERHSCT
jgi:superkiller protein 3